MRKNIFVERAKFSEVDVWGILHCFCSGAPVLWAAKYCELSPRTIRSVYLALRWDLRAQIFNPWHSMKMINPEEADSAPVFNFLQDTLQLCYFDHYCRRNYQLGNRKNRLCRGCAMRRVLPDDPETLSHLERYLGMVDDTWDFYRHLGLREKPGYNPVDTMKLQILHRAVVTTARKHSNHLPLGLVDHKQTTYLSGGRLMNVLATQLASFPIEVRERFFDIRKVLRD